MRQEGSRVWLPRDKQPSDIVYGIFPDISSLFLHK